jgi:uncharacterized repeat protein (TIGR01451 family)
MKRIFFTFLTLIIGAWLLVLPVKADCGGQYESPCQSYSILVDKTVARPDNGTYVDNLSTSDPRFSPGQYIYFRINITNTSTASFGDVTAKDFVPDYLTPVDGPGTFDSSTRSISWDAGSFNVNEQKSYYFKMQINSQANLPADKGLFCLTNRAQAWLNGTTDDDSSQFCIEKQVSSNIKNVPPTGPEFAYLLVTGEMLTLGTGIYMNYKLKNNK